MRLIRRATFLCGLLAAVCCRAEPPAKQNEQPVILAPRELDSTGFDCEAFVRVESDTVKVGDTFTVECGMRGTGGGEEIYNGFLWEEYKLPAQIVIVSTDGRVRHTLLQHVEGMAEEHKPRVWVRLAPGFTVGREFIVRIAGEGERPARQSPRDRIITLPPGEYYVQAIYNHWLIARRETGTGVNEDKPRPLVSRNGITYTDAQMAAPLAVSKPVKLTVERKSE